MFILYYSLLSVCLGLSGGSDGKESTCNAGDPGWITGLKRSRGGKHGNPLQYSCLENPPRQRCLVDYSPWGPKESDTTEQVSTAQHRIMSRKNVHVLIKKQCCWENGANRLA